MKDKFREYGCEFVNETACEEEMEEDKLSLEEEDGRHFDEEYMLYKEPYEDKDEKKFKELVEMGLEEKEAAHIVDKETYKHLKLNEKVKGGR